MTESNTLQAEKPAAVELGTPFVLTVVGGVDQGVVARIGSGGSSRVLIGTGPACELKLTDPQVSRRHAAVDMLGSRLRLEDLQSTNGTRVNGVAVREAFLEGGETVAIGSSQLRVERLGAEPLLLSTARGFGRLVGSSVAMRRLYPLCDRLSQSDVTVVIEGETGTGKEVLAESLHEGGPRRTGPFVVFDCTEVSPTLVESALFGHERGAFTGAVANQAGVFE